MTAPRVLVVEDNPITRKLYRVTLESAGYDVAEATDGQTAIEKVRSETPSLVLLDMILPDLSGLEVVGRLREAPEGEHLLVIAVSGFASASEPGQATAWGFDDILFKPVEPTRLIRMVASYLPASPPAAQEDLKGRRVLVCDDDTPQRKLLSLRLGLLGVSVTAAQDGQDALEKLGGDLPDAVVSDVLMPGLDGFGLCLAIRRDRRLANLPVILTSSSYVEPEDQSLANKVGATALVVRTPDYADIVSKVVEALRGPVNVVSSLASEDLTSHYAHRMVRQLERQVALNERLARQAALQAAELAVLSAISASLTRAVAGEVPLEEILARCLDAGGVSKGALFLRRDDGGLRLAAAIGHDEASRSELEGFFGHADWIQEVTRTGAALHLPSPTVPPAEARECLERAGVAHLLITPVVAENVPLGALVMGSQTPNLPNDDWFDFARTVASQLGQALALGRAVGRIRTSEERHRRLLLENEMILESAGEGICGLDGSGRVTFVNAAAVQMLGYLQHQIVGQPMHELTHRSRRDGSPYPAAECPILETLENGMTHLAVEDAFVRKDGSFLEVEFACAPIHESGRLAGAVVILKDITERKRQQQELAKQQAALHQSEKLGAMASLVAGVAHELNNPLSVVMGQASLLQRTARDTAMAPRAEKIVQAAERCARIVRNFLALARQQPPERQRVHLNQVVNETLELLGYQLRVDGVEVVLDLAAELPWLWADPHQLQQVMVNLVTNAQHGMRKTDRPHRLTLATSAAASGERVILSVADTGPGIPSEIQSRIFEPFFTTKPVGEGTGLGLSLCRGIVAEHGGEMRMTTEEQVGTCFVVELPAEGARPNGAPAASAEAQAPAGPEPKGKRVLVVDDEEPVREMLAELLRGDDHLVETAVNGADALEKTRADPYDLVICDVKMPVMDGPSFFREVQRAIPALADRFVFITGDVLSPDSREFLEEAGRPTLPKPFDVKEVRQVARRVLGNG